jgi:hypothetical protein
MLAFEAELAHLPRSLIAALWEAIDFFQPRRQPAWADLKQEPLS